MAGGGHAGVADTSDILSWLKAGDVSVRYQARRDLEGIDDPTLRARIAREGWGARFLHARNPDGSWGRGFYQPKWTSTHYTLLDLKLVGLPPDNTLARESIAKVLREERKEDGGVGPGKTIPQSDVCVNGMVLNYAAYFRTPEAELKRIVDYILGEQMGDGGFNCDKGRTTVHASSFASTLSVLEGICEYAANGYRYRLGELEAAARAGREVLLTRRLFRALRTGEIVRDDFLRLSFPPRWKYNVLRALDYFRAAGCPWDERMREALDVVLARRRPDGRWLAGAPIPGELHFAMEDARGPGRWTTLCAMRVIKRYG